MPIDGEVNQTCHPERGKKEGEEGGGGKQNIGGKRERERERQTDRRREREWWMSLSICNKLYVCADGLR